MFWSEVTSVWSVVTSVWSEVTFVWSEVTFIAELSNFWLERNDLERYSHGAKGTDTLK